MHLITANTNPKIKRLKALYKDKKLRLDEGLFVSEGVNFVKDVIDSGLVCELYIQESRFDELKFLTETDLPFYIVADGVFNGVADTVTPSGVIAVIKLKTAQEVTGDTVVILDGVSDLGNVGTIIRTACARGIESVVCINCADPYSPKAVRAAMCGIIKTNVITCASAADALKLVKGYEIVSLDAGGESVFDFKRKGKLAIVVGNEARGISEEMLKASAKILSIPMKENSIESLNAAVSASIAMYLI